MIRGFPNKLYNKSCKCRSFKVCLVHHWWLFGWNDKNDEWLWSILNSWSWHLVFAFSPDPLKVETHIVQLDIREMLLGWQQSFPRGKVEMTMKQMSSSSSSRYLMSLNNFAKQRRDWTSFMTLCYRESGRLSHWEDIFCWFHLQAYSFCQSPQEATTGEGQKWRSSESFLWRLAFFFPAGFRQLQTLLHTPNVVSVPSTANAHENVISNIPLCQR